MVTRAAKDLLRNTIRSTGYHNRLLEEEEMWKHWEVEKGLTMMVTDDYIRRRMRMDEYGGPSGTAAAPLCKDRLQCNMKELQKQKQAARESQRVGDNFWNRKLMEMEEKDPDRWGHSGYKELYPEEFKSSTSSKMDKHKNSSHDSSLCSSKKTKLPSESKKRKKRRKKHKKRHSRSRSASSERSAKEVQKAKKDTRKRSHSPSYEQSSPYENSASSSNHKSKNAKSSLRSPFSNGLSSPEVAEMHVQDAESDSSEDSGSLYSRPFLSDVSEAELRRRKEYLKRKLEEDSSDDSSLDESYPDGYSSQRNGSPERIHLYNESSNSKGRGPQYCRHKRKLKSHVVNVK